MDILSGHPVLFHLFWQQMSSGNLAMTRKDYAEAAKAFDRETKARPQNSEAWLKLADAYEQSSQPLKAVDALQHARNATQPPTPTKAICAKDTRPSCA